MKIAFPLTSILGHLFVPRQREVPNTAVVNVQPYLDPQDLMGGDRPVHDPFRYTTGSFMAAPVVSVQQPGYAPNPGQVYDQPSYAFPLFRPQG